MSAMPPSSSSRGGSPALFFLVLLSCSWSLSKASRLGPGHVYVHVDNDAMLWPSGAEAAAGEEAADGTPPVAVPPARAVDIADDSIDCLAPSTPRIELGVPLDYENINATMAAVSALVTRFSCPHHLLFHLVYSEDNYRDTQPLVGKFILPLMFDFNVYLFSRGKSSGSSSTTIMMSTSHDDLVRMTAVVLLRNSVNSAVSYLNDYNSHAGSGFNGHGVFDQLVVLDPNGAPAANVVADYITSLLGDQSPLPNSTMIVAPVYCSNDADHGQLTYFTSKFWEGVEYSTVEVFKHRDPCHFNTGLMLMNFEQWRKENYTNKIAQGWKRNSQDQHHHIYKLASLPPFLVIFI